MNPFANSTDQRTKRAMETMDKILATDPDVLEARMAALSPRDLASISCPGWRDLTPEQQEHYIQSMPERSPVVGSRPWLLRVEDKP